MGSSLSPRTAQNATGAVLEWDERSTLGQRRLLALTAGKPHGTLSHVSPILGDAMSMYGPGATALMREKAELEKKKEEFAKWVVANKGAMSVKDIADKMEAMNRRSDEIDVELQPYQLD